MVKIANIWVGHFCHFEKDGFISFQSGRKVLKNEPTLPRSQFAPNLQVQSHKGQMKLQNAVKVLYGQWVFFK